MLAKYLVTGGCGFIGAQLTDTLIALGHQVIIIDDLSNGFISHPQATLIQQDLRQFNAINQLFHNIDGCFHLAAIPTANIKFKDWLNAHETNLKASLNVFKAAIDAGNVPVVYASSCSVYGNSHQLPLDEAQIIHPISSYGCDKFSTELNASFLHELYGFSSIGLRLFNVYGPNQSTKSLYPGAITTFISRALNHEPIIIFGDGAQKRDFIYVDDVVHNLIYAMESLTNGAHIVNICSGQPTSINQLVKTLEELLNQPIITKYKDQTSYETQYSIGCYKKMMQYGFKITQNLQQGLLKTIENFQSNCKQNITKSHQPTNLNCFANLASIKDYIQNILQQPLCNQLTLLLLNIDNLHLVNDLYGSYIGDLLLKTIEQKILQQCNNNRQLICKDSDEFILLLLNLSHAEIEKFTKSLAQELSQPFEINQQKIFITISMGLSLWPKDTINADELLSQARFAMHTAKENGKNTYQYYAPKIRSNAHYQYQLQKQLSNILDNDELSLYYQPQQSLQTKQIIGFEALLRWNNAKLGLIYPHNFIHLTEKTGLINPIGEWVLQKACQEAKKWQKNAEHLRVTVNVSVAQLQNRHGHTNKNFIHNVRDALNTSSLPPELLELEITESILMRINKETLACIKTLTNLGIKIACDDFGIGYSSYSRILQLPLNTIKIDQSLIKNLSYKLINPTILVEGIIEMAHKLNIKCIAEGVETKEQMDILQNLNCDCIQGNYFSKPISSKKINSFLLSSRK